MEPTEQQRESQLIEDKYAELLAACRQNRNLTQEEQDNIFRAFTIARNAHEGIKRKSGEPYILHPLSVALIAVREVGLGPTAVISAILHDVVEDTDITLEEIRIIFGERIARIVDGVTKINTIARIVDNRHSPTNQIASHLSLQAENYRKILLAMCNDVYVIFIKLCDRLHNMRTLSSMPDTKQIAIASETQYLYIPIAHRLGLYNIKTELEELVMKYTNPSTYEEISHKLEGTTADVERLKECFTNPICRLLDQNGLKYQFKSRIKSVYSCWKKMQNKGVDFDEIYDLFAVRIILDVPPEREKAECFKVYAIISNLFPPNPSRFRDWITTPKNNGYESLHITVMTPIGRWVEVQIRSQRMDELAEKGMAAHFLYKEAHPDEHIEGNPVEEWLQQIRASLENSEKSALDLVEEFKETLYTKEIYLFTPKGETLRLPSRSTVLDFAYAIHTQLGNACMGAKVNAKVVPISYVLHSGEQVQIITSRKTQPTEEWLAIATTTRAKEHIKDSLRLQKREHLQSGMVKYASMMRELDLEDTAESHRRARRYFNLGTNLDLFYRIDTGAITMSDLSQCFGLSKKAPKLFFLEPYKHLFDVSATEDHPETESEDNETTHSPFLLDKEYSSIVPEPAPCCKPIQGDEVLGIMENGKIWVHRTNCPEAMHTMSIHKERIIRAHWRKGEQLSFLTGISITAIDRKGMMRDITRVISEQMDLNIRATTFESTEGVGRGIVMLYVHSLDNLNNLMHNLRRIDGVENVKRI